MNDLERRLEEINKRLFELDSRLDKYDEIERLNIEKETIREMINMKTYGDNAIKYYVGLEICGNIEEELECCYFDEQGLAEQRFKEIADGLALLKVDVLGGFWGVYDEDDDEYHCYAICDADGITEVE